MTEPSFSLIDEPWITVRLHDGTVTDLSLGDVFARADEIDSLASDLAVIDFALFRLLLAIMYGAIGHERFQLPADWAALWQSGLPTAELHDYLERYSDRFDLLDPVAPFFQVAGLRTAKNEVSGLEKLLLDVPNGAPLFTTRLGSGLARISFAEAARLVVTNQAFNPSGIKSGAVGDDRVKGGRGYPIGTGWAGSIGGIAFEGASLRETLLLNFVGMGLRADLDWLDDAPVWHRDPQGPAEDPAARVDGPASIFTWQSRRIRLAYDADGVTGVLIANGDRVGLANQHRFETMTRWRRSQPQEKKLSLPLVYMARPNDPSRALWRGVASFLPVPQGKLGDASFLPSLTADWLGELRALGALPADHAVRMRVVGLEYGAQSSTIADQIDDSLLVDLDVAASTDPVLHALLERAADQADAGARAIGELAGNLAAAEGKLAEPARDRARDQAYSRLDGEFRAWIAAVRTHDDFERDEQAWRDTCRRTLVGLGAELIGASGPTAWQGRNVGGRPMNTSLAGIYFNRRLRDALGGQPDTQEAA